ncbi:syntaphilin [Camarhynchus parvulus]|uniref:syntaphilin n=1 Tax=Geospiza parvula TaxID=87175 RepID=UPI001238129B|nr:syntaphilin [Camarhynchus parvulus]
MSNRAVLENGTCRAVPCRASHRRGGSKLRSCTAHPSLPPFSIHPSLPPFAIPPSSIPPSSLQRSRPPRRTHGGRRRSLSPPPRRCRPRHRRGPAQFPVPRSRGTVAMSVPGSRRASTGSRRRPSPPGRDTYGTSSLSSSSNSGSCKGSDSSPTPR